MNWRLGDGKFVKCFGLWWVYIEGKRGGGIERCDWLDTVSRGSPAWQGRAVQLGFQMF